MQPTFYYLGEEGFSRGNSPDTQIYLGVGKFLTMLHNFRMYPESRHQSDWEMGNDSFEFELCCKLTVY